MTVLTRRHLIHAGLGCCAAGLAGHAVAQGARPDFTFKEIGEGVWLHVSHDTLSNGLWYPSNGVVVVGETRVLMLDTAWTPDQTETLLDSIRLIADKKPIDLFVTHFHADRLGGLPVTAAAGITSHGFSRTIVEAKAHSGATFDVMLNGPTHLFDLGGRKVEVFYPGPGHTVDNAVGFDPKTGVLFGGCMMRALETDNLGNTADAYVPNWAASVKRVAARYPDTKLVVPGHLSPGDAAIYAHTIKLAGG
jgi:glyoxylase-like metal-dependent hydrolase (beta-lactamase superfamily II)